MSFVEVSRGESPLVLGLPHTGTDLPDDVAARLNNDGLALADTDWHIHDLYDQLVPEVTTVRTKVHRYVIDVNRDPAGASLYPGQNTTGLCPVTDFDGCLIYRTGQEPDAEEIKRRRIAYHDPYHLALAGELDRVRSKHGYVILYDCHSIRSIIPYLFEGTLPDFNIGTNQGETCARSIEATVTGICAGAEGFNSVLNGRFKGGWTTRQYGRPNDGYHAIQMELAQSTYLEAEQPPWIYETQRAAAIREHLKTILLALIDARPQ
ncbi:MAG: N-formylglutamate deformylase [Boseongicola sp.]